MHGKFIMLNSWTISSETFTFYSLPLHQDVFVLPPPQTHFVRSRFHLLEIPYIYWNRNLFVSCWVLRPRWEQPLWRTWCWSTWYVHVHTVGNVQVITNNYVFCKHFLEEYFSNWFPLLGKNIWHWRFSL